MEADAWGVTYDWAGDDCSPATADAVSSYVWWVTAGEGAVVVAAAAAKPNILSEGGDQQLENEYDRSNWNLWSN